MYGYGRQVQEYKQRLKQSRSSRRHNMANHGYSRKYHNNISLTPLLGSQPQQIRGTTSTTLLPNAMEPSISAPNYTLEKHHITDVETETDLIEVNSDDSVETIGKCTNTSIVTGPNYLRTDSPINHSKLQKHSARYNSRNFTNANLRRYTLQQMANNNNNNSNTNSMSFQYPTPQQIYRSGLQQQQQQIHDNDTEQLVWRHPGGVVSLLEILGRVLRSTEEQLVAIGKIASLTDFVQNVCNKSRYTDIICIM